MRRCFFLAAILWPPNLAYAATLTPEAVLPSDLVVQVEKVGQVHPTSTSSNLTSPVLIDGKLYMVDQNGSVLREGASSFEEVIGLSSLPAGITPGVKETVLNISEGPDGTAYVVFTSRTLPTGTYPVSSLPGDPIYTENGVSYHVVYKYDVDAQGNFVDPKPLSALETRGRGHTGGGMLTLPNGDLLLATGDNLDFNRDGLSAPQDPDEHVSKLLIIDQDTGELTVAAMGVRNVQRVAYADESQSTIIFSEIGADTADEINLLSVADLTDTSVIENFGWGRNPDGNAREGTFYINDGATSLPGTVPAAIGQAPIPEAGFIQPFAQFRTYENTLFAVSGPVVSDPSFDEISVLFGDLFGGQLLATTGPLSGVLSDVFEVHLVDVFGQSTTLLDLAGSTRADPRFFLFADNTAGVVLEGTGEIFRLTELPPSVVPLPASFGFLLAALGLLMVQRRSS